jgi:hypothetical protein
LEWIRSKAVKGGGEEGVAPCKTAVLGKCVVVLVVEVEEVEEVVRERVRCLDFLPSCKRGANREPNL